MLVTGTGKRARSHALALSAANLANAAILSSAAVFMAVATAAGAATPKAGDKAPDFTLNALDGGKVKLSALYKKGPVALIALRGYPGYQCPICTAQVGELIGSAAKFAEKKALVLLVYPGPSENLKQRASEFVQGKTLPANFRLALDPDYVFTRKYGLRWDAPNETAYPASFVIDAKGKTRFAKISHSHGDRATADELLKALDR